MRLYMALKEAHGGAAWYDWEPELVAREPEALARWSEKLAEQIRFYQFVQYAFARQWTALREACRERDIRLIGDMPIFVAQDSADVWARPDLFQLDETGRPLVVAGVPPDYFSETGQLWGNPLYRWEAHAAERFAWWIARLKASTDRVDLVRLDHFRGFEAYWEVPAGCRDGRDRPLGAGPGRRVPRGARERARRPAARSPRTWARSPPRSRRCATGSSCPACASSSSPSAATPATPITCRTTTIHHCVVYTGTHDNDTTRRLVHELGRRDDPVARAGPGRAGLRPALPGHVGRRDPLGPDPGGVRLGGRHGHHPHAGRPRPRQLGPDERAGPCEGTGAGGSGPTSSTRARDRLADMTAVYGRWNGPAEPGIRPPARAQSPEPSPLL